MIVHDEFYKMLGSGIMSAINEEWLKAQLSIETDSTYCKIAGKYQDKDGQERNLDVHKIPNQLNYAIMDFHEIIHTNGMSKWNRAVFTLTPDNKFDMKFIWDQELADKIERLSKES